MMTVEEFKENLKLLIDAIEIDAECRSMGLKVDKDSAVFDCRKILIKAFEEAKSG